MSRIGWSGSSTVAIILTAGILAAWLLRPPPRPQGPAEQVHAMTGSERSGSPLLSRDEASGRLLFERYCGMCHGREGDGFGINAPNLPLAVPDLASSTGINTWDDVRLFARIARGGGTSGQPPVCPAWGPRLAPREIDALVAFLRVLSRAGRAGRSVSYSDFHFGVA